jgi:NAD(P)-dependent dehydrogenase (short-subunit alcohol dehydrogenase family)
MRFSSRTVLVTGGGSGIGRAVVERLAAEGARVVVTDIKSETAEETVAALSVESRHLARELDVTDVDAVARLFEEVANDVGDLHAIIHSAGRAFNVPFPETTTEQWHETMDVNALGTFAVGKAAVHTFDGRGGSIVNIGSISGLVGNAGQAAYAASKAAVSGLTRVMASELASVGIRVNEIAPGPIETQFSRAMTTERSREARIRRLPLGRFGTPSEVAAAAVFLASDDASYITGQTIVVDGGFVAAGMLG